MTTIEYVRRQTSDGESVRDVVSAAVAELVDLESAEQLSSTDAVDLEALESLFRSSDVDGPQPRGYLTFELAECVVTIYSGGHVVAFRKDQALHSELESSALLNDGFTCALQQLINGAYRNDIDVQDSWSLRTQSAYPDWEVEIVEVTKPIHDRS